MLRLFFLAFISCADGFILPAFRAPVARPLVRPYALLAAPLAVHASAISATTSDGRTLPHMSIAPDTRRQEPTAVYALLVANIALFVADKVLRLAAVRQLYLYHGLATFSNPGHADPQLIPRSPRARTAGWRWFQPLSATFCHASRAHLSGNAFLLLLFGRSDQRRADTYSHVPGPPYCTCGPRVPASRVRYVPKAPGSLQLAPGGHWFVTARVGCRPRRGTCAAYVRAVRSVTCSKVGKAQ